MRAEDVLQLHRININHVQKKARSREERRADRTRLTVVEAVNLGRFRDGVPCPVLIVDGWELWVRGGGTLAGGSWGKLL